MLIKKNIILMLTLFVLIACQPQNANPAVSVSATATDLPTPSPAMVASATSTPEATPTLTEEPPGPFQFESIKMFDEDGAGEIEKTSGWAVALLPDNSEYILHTNDGGQTWKRSALTMGIQYTYSPPIFLSSQVAWNTNTDNKLEQTRDGGQSWTSLVDFSTNPVFSQGVGLHFWDADHGVSISGTPAAGTAFLTLSKTYDGGINWERLDLTPPWKDSISDSGELLLCNLCADRIYVDSSRLMIVGGLTPNQAFASTVDITISLDEGKTWKYGQAVVPEELVDRQARFGEMTFFDDQHGVFSLWATNKKSFEYYEEYSILFSFYTQDGGLHWRLRTPTPTADISQQLVGFEKFLSPNEAILRCGTKLCVTHDGAQSWTLIQPDVEFPESTDTDVWMPGLDFINPSLGFTVITPSSDITHLYRTNDGGLHWTRIEYQLTD